MTTALESLPREMTLEVVSYLPPSEVLNLRLVSTCLARNLSPQFMEIAQDRIVNGTVVIPSFTWPHISQFCAACRVPTVATQIRVVGVNLEQPSLYDMDRLLWARRQLGQYDNSLLESGLAVPIFAAYLNFQDVHLEHQQMVRDRKDLAILTESIPALRHLKEVYFQSSTESGNLWIDKRVLRVLRRDSVRERRELSIAHGLAIHVFLRAVAAADLSVEAVKMTEPGALPGSRRPSRLSVLSGNMKVEDHVRTQSWTEINSLKHLTQLQLHLNMSDGDPVTNASAQVFFARFMKACPLITHVDLLFSSADHDDISLLFNEACVPRLQVLKLRRFKTDVIPIRAFLARHRVLLRVLSLHDATILSPDMNYIHDKYPQMVLGRGWGAVLPVLNLGFQLSELELARLTNIHRTSSGQDTAWYFGFPRWDIDNHNVENSVPRFWCCGSVQHVHRSFDRAIARACGLVQVVPLGFGNNNRTTRL